MKNTKSFKVGDRVRPANDGEDQPGDILHWTRLRGTVRALWIDCGEERVEVRWDRKAPYPTSLPTYLLTHADKPPESEWVSVGFDADERKDCDS